MLRAFIDDSGSDQNSPWYVLAGYVGTVEGWDKFDSPWLDALHSNPRVEYFHASEAESLKFGFQGLNKSERDAKIDALIDVIGQCAHRAVCARMRRRDYDELVKGKIPHAWDSPYYFLFPTVIAASINIERIEGKPETVDFVFDDDSAHRKIIPRLLPNLFPMQSMFGSLVNVVRKDDTQFLPLQAADLLAWQIRRFFSEISEPRRAHYDRCRKCLPEEPHEFVLTRGMLKTMIDDINQRAVALAASFGRSPDVRTWD